MNSNLLFAEANAALKESFEDESAPVTLFNLVPAAEAWQPGEKELKQKGGTLQHCVTAAVFPAEQQTAPQLGCVRQLLASQIAPATSWILHIRSMSDVHCVQSWAVAAHGRQSSA